MWYEIELAIPAGTAVAAPVEARLQVTWGVIHRILVEAAPGCHRQAAVRLYYREHQIAPSNSDEDFALDGVPRDYEERIPLLTPPYELVLRGYSPDADYAHTYRVGLGILPPEALPDTSPTTSALDKFLRLVGVRR